MTSFFAILVLDGQGGGDPESIPVEIEAIDMTTATRILNAYLLGRFAGSVRGGEITSISRTKARGIKYGRLG